MLQGNKANLVDTHQETTFWEKIASSRWGAYTSEIERQTILKAHQAMEAPAYGLEIGAEGGRWSRMLTDLGWTMTCTDINADALALCQRRVPSARCILVKAEDEILPCASNSANLVLCVEVMPVLQSNWFMGEVTRVLRPGGMLVGVFQNRASLRGAFGHIKAKLTRTYDWYQYSYREWRKGLIAHGYSMFSEVGFCHFPFGRFSNSALVPICVRIEMHLGLRRMVAISPWIAFVAKKQSDSFSSQ
jgi:SAM-dependent methyltransferase